MHRSLKLGAVVSSIAALVLSSFACRKEAVYPDPVGAIDPDVTATGGRKGGTGGTRGSSGVAGNSGTVDPPVAPAGDDGGGDVVPPVGDAGGPVDPVDTGLPPPPPAAATGHPFRFNEVATWSGNATGAYTIMHEEVCDSAFLGSIKNADPELKQRGLRGAFGVVAASCESGKLWPQIMAMVASGHEVLNQGASGVCLAGAAACGAGVARSTNFAKEIDGAGTTIKAKIGVQPAVFVFPYDACDAASSTYVKGHGFLGARCGQAGVNDQAFADPFAFKFDLWGPGVSTYRTAAPCAAVKADAAPTTASAACRTYVLNHGVDEAISKKGWVVRGFHGFAGDMGTYQPVALADYRAHLDYVVTKVTAGALWVAGPSEIIKYRFARQNCVAPMIAMTAAGSALSFAAPSAECSKYATALSYVVSTTDGSDPAALAVMQMGQRLVGKKTGPGTFVVSADPTKGDALLVE